MKTRHHSPEAAGFTFVEALMTIAILGILSAIVVTAFSNAGTDSARIMARQQQAAIQSGVNAWVNSEVNRTDQIGSTGRGKLRTIAEIMAAYNTPTTTLARFNLISGYMDSNTVAYFTTYSTSSQILSDAMNTSAMNITLPTWTAGSYPQVLLNSN